MNVCSLELAKELYKLSGWFSNDCPHWYLAGKPARYRLVDSNGKPYETENEKGEVMWQNLTAYDLGYLIRKLPYFLQLSELSGGYTPNGWRAEKRRSQEYDYEAKADADTPEDAACLLAIKLWKQGILK
jgi:hypothetical protein